MLSKALLPTNLCAIDFKATLDDWGIPSRMVVNASGSPSRYVVFQGEMLSPGQISYLDATHAPVYCRIDIWDIKFISEVSL